jgi:hypothetical protein
MVGISGSPDHGRDALTDEISVGKLGKRNDVSKMGRLVEDRNIFVFLGEPTHLKVFFWRVSISDHIPKEERKA